MARPNHQQQHSSESLAAYKPVSQLPSYQWLLFLVAAGILIVAILLGAFSESYEGQGVALDGRTEMAFTVLAYAPYLFVWLVGRIGYRRLKHYIVSVRSTEEGASFAAIARGVFLITIWLPISAVATIIASLLFYRHIWFVPYLVLLLTYANTLFFGFAYWYFYQGSDRLLGSLGKRVPLPLAINLIFITLATVFAYLVMQHPVRPGSIQGTVLSGDILPKWMQLMTVIVPRILGWYVGLQAAFNICIYRRFVPGKIYKDMLSNLAMGLGGVVLLSILLRSLQTLNLYLGILTVEMRLAILYGMLVLLSGGFYLLARGAAKLQHIESL